MIIVGITGLIASGKSSVAAMFNSCGVHSFDADKIVHELYGDKDIASAVGKVAPGVVVNGRLDRAALSKVAVNNSEILKQLEEFIHPMVRDKMNEFLNNHKESNSEMVLLDIPLLFEGGINEICDYVFYTKCSDEDLTERYLARENSNLEKLEKILIKQNNYDKEKLADYIIDTSNDIEETKAEVTKLIKDIKEKYA